MVRYNASLRRLLFLSITTTISITTVAFLTIPTTMIPSGIARATTAPHVLISDVMNILLILQPSQASECELTDTCYSFGHTSIFSTIAATILQQQRLLVLLR